MTILQDLRYALRTLSRNPGLVIAAVICLALGIGANATIFGVVVTMMASYLPARRASNVDPVEALRYE